MTIQLKLGTTIPVQDPPRAIGPGVTLELPLQVDTFMQHVVSAFARRFHLLPLQSTVADGGYWANDSRRLAQTPRTSTYYFRLEAAAVRRPGKLLRAGGSLHRVGEEDGTFAVNVFVFAASRPTDYRTHFLAGELRGGELHPTNPQRYPWDALDKALRIPLAVRPL